MALSLYNKYRPQTFGDVVGQHHVEKTLANAVEHNTVSHAYLFTGPRGTGKTTTARILAKALLCEQAPTSAPDGTCEECLQIAEGVHPDVYELDAASRTGVDNVREEIIGRVNFAPTRGAYKMYIIDEVHMLSTPAFNALLKTLEEPPAHVVFVLCTTDVHKVPDTVQARCQRFDFKHLTVSEIVGRLQYICEKEGFEYEPAALELIAQRSLGGMRDAIGSLEQVAVFSSGKISYAACESLLGMVDSEQLFLLCEYIAAGDAASCFDWVANYVQNGSDIAILVNDLATHVRNLYAVHIAKGSEEHVISALEIDAQQLPLLRAQALKLGSPERLGWMLSVLGKLSSELKNAANARLALEVAITRILRPESEMSLEALAVRVANLEAQLALFSGGVVPAGYTGGNASTPEPSLSHSTPAASTSAPANHTYAATATTSPQTDDTSPTPSTPAASGGAFGTSDEQALYRKWNSVVDAIKKEKRGVAASLGGITPLLSREGTQLTLEFPTKAATSMQYLETEANKALIEHTVQKVFGSALGVRFALASDRAVSAAPTEVADRPAEAQAPAQPEPTKEELDNILSKSLNGSISFEEQ